MCDTFVVVKDGRVWFAKNSDRDPNEAQRLDWRPRRTHAPEVKVRCTHIEVPQIPETYGVLLSRPFWMWGAEMGANEHGVVIGNEAVFTKKKVRASGLTGMDLLRLALERSESAEGAVETITSLLEEHHQGGGCGHENRDFRYHNSFLIADHKGAFVLETADDEWAVERVESGARSISNGLTIPDFSAEHRDPLKSRVAACDTRTEQTRAAAEEASDLGGMMRALRGHGDDEWPRYALINGTLSMPCMHGGGVVASSLSTASWVCELTADGAAHWVTGTSSPCLSLFKPVALDQPVELGPDPNDRADGSLWWAHERLHRSVMRDPANLATLFLDERDEEERTWLESPPDSEVAFARHRELIDRWQARVDKVKAKDRRPIWARSYWKTRDKRAGL
jgi:dipeptidase